METVFNMADVIQRIEMLRSASQKTSPGPRVVTMNCAQLLSDAKSRDAHRAQREKMDKLSFSRLEEIRSLASATLDTVAVWNGGDV